MESLSPNTPALQRLRNAWEWTTRTEGRKWGVPPLLLLILVVALGLRLYGINWDQGGFFHPDERSIYMRADCMYRLLAETPGYQSCMNDAPFQSVVPGFPGPTVFLDADKSPLNPHWFPLGTGIIYLLVGVKWILSPIVSMDLDDLALVGRTLSTLADVATIGMVYVLGKRLFGRGAGLLAAALVTFAPVHIQLSHFYRPETFTNLFILAGFWAMLQVLERRRVRDSALLGLFVGLAFATKVSVLPLLLPLAALYGYLFLDVVRRPRADLRAAQMESSYGYVMAQASSPVETLQPSGRLERVALRALVGGFAALAIYLFSTPYALLDFSDFLAWNLRELGIVRNAGIVPYTVQYMGAPDLIYELRQTVTWGLGLPLGLLAWAGLLATVFVNLRRPRWGQVLLLLWAVPLLLTVVGVEVKFLRYTFPLMPVMVVLGSGVALAGVRWLRDRRPSLARACMVLLGVTLAFTVFYGLAFQSIFSRPHTAVQASRWLNENVPYTATILTDNHWDEGIPDLGRYSVTQLPMFEGDTLAKMQSVTDLLAGADYLLFYSNRTYGAIARVPERYPLSSAYYRQLFSGDLGYVLDKSFDSYPSFLGVTFADDPFGRANVSRPEGLEPPASSVTLDLGYADNDAITYDHPLVLVFRNEANYDSQLLLSLIMQDSVELEPILRLVLTPQELVIQQQGGTWSQIFSEGGLADRFPVIVWLLLVQATSLAVLPLGFLVFRGLHDRGYLLSKTLGLLLLAYIPWILAALKILSFSRSSIYLGLFLLAAVGLVITATRYREMASFVRQRWRILAFEEALFLLAFFVFLAIRWANPDLWHPFRGGEKPMDFAYLNAVVRSTTIPPFDPWFAGGYLNYYYYGQFIVATLIKATGVLPDIAYNLAVPLLFALTAGGAFSVVYGLTSALRRRGPGKWASWGPAAAGTVAVLMVVVLGNLGGAAQIVSNAWNAVTSGASFPPFDFWASSRMMPGQIIITEFPFWTFLFADLHAHLIAIPFTLLAAGLSLNLVLTSGEARLNWRTAVLPLGALALTIGALWTINSWDYPTYLALGVVAVLIATYASRQRLDLAFVRQAALWSGVLAVLSYVAYLPFHARNAVYNAGIHSSIEQTAIIHYLGVNGLFLFLVVSYLAYEGRIYLVRAMNANLDPDTRRRNLVIRTLWAMLASPAVMVGVSVTIVLTAYLIAAGYGTVAFLFLLTLAAAVLAVFRVLERSREASLHLFILTLLIGALSLGILVDLVTVNNDIDRMNTVFKLYLQAWVLYALASAVVLWYLASAVNLSWRRITWAKGLWAGALALLIVGVSVFPVLGTRERLADRFSAGYVGLSGTEFMERTVYRDPNGPIILRWDWAAIQWLRDNVEGSPVIAEGSTEPVRYLWGNRVSIYTGLPTIIGWNWHQIQQRLGEQEVIGQRLGHLTTLYTTTDESLAVEIIDRYSVAYIYVGELERLYYPEEGLAKFNRMEDKGVTRVYDNPQVSIYRVLPPPVGGQATAQLEDSG